jgi:hypothetical protein
MDQLTGWSPVSLWGYSLCGNTACWLRRSRTLGKRSTMLSGEALRNVINGFRNRAWYIIDGGVSESPFFILGCEESTNGPIWTR